MTVSWVPSWLILAVAVLATLAGCHDESAERYARARASYEALLTRGERPEAKAFDAVLADLDAVEPGSRDATDAARLAAAIRLGREPHLRTPLALNPKPGTRPAELEAQLAACARLAQLAGEDGGVERRAMVALEACRRRAEEIDVRLSGCGGHGDAGELP